MTNNKKQTTLFSIALAVALSSSVWAQNQPAPNTNNPIVFNATTPPSTGRPGRRSDAGSRGCGGDETSDTAQSQSLLALVPIQETANTKVVFGKTASEHPTFWFYVPDGSALTATFVLQDRDGNLVYQSDVPLPQKSGILSVSLPTTVTPLETGKLYHWFFKLYCRSISPPDSFVDGWIQRESPTSELSDRLPTSTLQQQVRLYAANGFWFEALTAAAQLRQTDAEDSAWADLLKAIGLEISNE
jgi:hypothetical protein